MIWYPCLLSTSSNPNEVSHYLFITCVTLFHSVQFSSAQLTYGTNSHNGLKEKKGKEIYSNRATFHTHTCNHKCSSHNSRPACWQTQPNESCMADIVDSSSFVTVAGHTVADCVWLKTWNLTPKLIKLTTTTTNKEEKIFFFVMDFNNFILLLYTVYEKSIVKVASFASVKTCQKKLNAQKFFSCLKSCRAEKGNF